MKLTNFHQRFYPFDLQLLTIHMRNNDKFVIPISKISTKFTGVVMENGASMPNVGYGKPGN